MAWVWIARVAGLSHGNPRAGQEPVSSWKTAPRGASEGQVTLGCKISTCSIPASAPTQLSAGSKIHLRQSRVYANKDFNSPATFDVPAAFLHIFT